MLRSRELGEGRVFVFLDGREGARGGFDRFLGMGQDAALAPQRFLFIRFQGRRRDLIDLILEQIEPEGAVALGARQLFELRSRLGAENAELTAEKPRQQDDSCSERGENEDDEQPDDHWADER